MDDRAGCALAAILIAIFLTLVLCQHPVESVQWFTPSIRIIPHKAAYNWDDLEGKGMTTMDKVRFMMMQDEGD